MIYKITQKLWYEFNSKIDFQTIVSQSKVKKTFVFRSNLIVPIETKSNTIIGYKLVHENNYSTSNKLKPFSYSQLKKEFAGEKLNDYSGLRIYYQGEPYILSYKYLFEVAPTPIQHKFFNILIF